MERDLVPGRREAGMEEERSSRSVSSGCQSGWTLYLDHSDAQRHRCHHLDPGHQRWTMLPRAVAVDEDDESDDDSMVSDASSGPPPPTHLLDDDDHELLRDHGQEQRCCCCSSSGGVAASASGSVSTTSFFGTQQSRSFVQGRHQETRTAVVHDEDDLDLDDTASSSVVLSCRPMAAAMVYIAPAAAESMSSSSYTML